MRDLNLPAALTPGRLWVQGQVKIPFWRGQLTISDLTVRDPLSAGFQARLRAVLAGLDLAAAPALDGRLEGNLSGALFPVRITLDSLFAGGHLSGKFFGGDMQVSQIGLQRPLSPGRLATAQIAVKGLSAARLSRAFNLGEISGRLDLRLRDLAVAHGQPVGFSLRVRSVKTPGVSQRVSLKAVNSISVIGTGSGLSGVGIGLMSAFLSDFPYQEIGFAVSLANDRFAVRGLILEDGVEYLVKKPALMGINVINRNPDNTIGFSDMLERLKRVTAPQAKEEK